MKKRIISVLLIFMSFLWLAAFAQSPSPTSSGPPTVPGPGRPPTVPAPMPNRPYQSTPNPITNPNPNPNINVNPNPNTAMPQPARPAVPGRAGSSGTVTAPVRIEPGVVKSLKNGKMLLNFESADIRVIARLISELTGKNIIMDDRVTGRISIISSREVSAKEAWKMFVSALNAYGFDVVDWGKSAKILPSKLAIKERTRFYSENNVARGQDYLIAVVALKYGDPEQIANVLRQLQTENGSIMPYNPSRSILIADEAYNVKKLVKLARHLDSTKQRPMLRTFYLRNSLSTEVAKAIDQVYKPNDKGVTISDFASHNAVIVMGTSRQIQEIESMIDEMDRFIGRPDQIRKFRVIKLQNANAEEVAKILSEMLKEGERAGGQTAGGTNGSPQPMATAPPAQPGNPANPSSLEGSTTSVVKNFVSNKVSADKDTNSIVLFVSDAELNQIMPMVCELDCRRKQVLVSAIIAEVSLKRIQSSGVNWQILNAGQPLAAFGGGKSYENIYQILASGNFVVGGIGTQKTTININGRKVEFPNVFALIQFLNDDNDFNVLSIPRVLTLDNKEATMNVGSIIPFATGVKFDANGQPLVTYDYKDVGLTLTVTPHIGQGEMVRLDVKQKIQDVTDYLQQNLGAVGYVVPIVSTRNVETTVHLGDAQTVIIGGLVSRRTIESIKKIPLLGDIPGLGVLFKNRNKERDRTTLFIFLTPHIIEDPTRLSDITEKYTRVINDPALQEQKGKIPVPTQCDPKPKLD